MIPMFRTGWRAIRMSIAIFALALAGSGAMLGAAAWHHDRAVTEHKWQQGRLESIRSRYRTIDEQRRIIETWLPEFRSLEAAGIVGEERRLAWIETLRAAAADLKLPSLRYRIEPRAVHDPGLALGTTAYLPFSTVVRLEAGLLHEGDFERLVREIALRDPGLHRIESCTLHRTGPHLVMRGNAVNLGAECDLRWITLARSETQ